MDVLGRIREVLRIEKEGIEEILDRITPEFEKVVDILKGCKGRVVVTGIGKTGIIGRKFSATLASTGTPSLWFHPVEAIHGDLGMVLREDVVVVLSNSGESEEIVRLIPFVKKIGAGLIGITGNRNSTLARYSDVFLDIGISKEACTLGLIPTTSTTVALAVCDAIAVALLELKGFNLADYAFYHPGGVIGRKLLTVKDIMRTGGDYAVVAENAPVKDVLMRITEARAGSATVIGADGKVAGIFTDGDLRRSLERDSGLLNKPVSSFMTRDPVRVRYDTLVMEALNIIRQRRIDELIVVDDEDRPVGIVDEKDLLGLG